MDKEFDRILETIGVEPMVQTYQNLPDGTRERTNRFVSTDVRMITDQQLEKLREIVHKKAYNDGLDAGIHIGRHETAEIWLKNLLVARWWERLFFKKWLLQHNVLWHHAEACGYDEQFNKWED